MPRLTVNDAFFESTLQHFLRRPHAVLDIECGRELLSLVHCDEVTFAAPRLTPEVANCPVPSETLAYSWKECSEQLPTDRFDTVLLRDVVSRYPKADALRILERTKSIARQQLVVTVGLYVNTTIPITDWNTEDFDEGWLVVVSDSPGGLRFAAIWFRPPKYRCEVNAPPQFSIVVPTYNDAMRLPNALDSIMRQSYPHWEAIVVDDGSKDNTWEALQALTVQDPRIRAFHKENGGTGSALNFGFEQAKHPWICWLSSDDLFLPHNLHIKADVIMNESSGCDFIYGASILFAQDTGKATTFTHPPCSGDPLAFGLALMSHNFVNGISICIHRELASHIGRFREQFRFAQDADYWLRASAHSRPHYVSLPGVISMTYPGQATRERPAYGLLENFISILQFINSGGFQGLASAYAHEESKFEELGVGLLCSALGPSLLETFGVGHLYVDLLAGLLLSRGAGPADYRRLVSCWVRVLSPFWNSRFTDLIHRLDSLYFSGRGWTVLDPVDYARNLLSRSIAPAFRQAIEDLICTRQLDYGGPNGHPKDPFRFSGMLTNV